MTCNDVQARLSEWLDGDTGGLIAAERAAIAAHLETCAECRGELDRLKDASALVRALPRLHAPAYVQGRALALGREYAEEMRERGGARGEDVPRIAALSGEMRVAEMPPPQMPPPRPRPPAPMQAPAPTGRISQAVAGHVRSPRHPRGRNVRLVLAAAVAAAMLGLAYLFFR
jgi:hypothetical protein